MSFYFISDKQITQNIPASADLQFVLPYKVKNMNDNEFEIIVELKVKDLVTLIKMNTNNNLLVDALQYLYESKLYQSLIREETKLWHLSAEKLFDMLIIEKETNELIYPDFV